MRFVKRAVAALAFAVLPFVATAEQPVTTFSLDNGMQVVVIEDHRAPVVTNMVWYRVGAADEPRGVSGLAHFLEHLMFKGTDEIPDGAFSKIIAANGGQDNAFTSYDYTGYFQKIAADRLEMVMRMEADRMTDTVITQTHILAERDVILEERSSRTDNSPSALFQEQMRAALYLNHAYGVPVVGWRHEMEQLSLEDVEAFYARYYAPDNAILVVAGDTTPDEVRTLANKYFAPIPASGHPPDPRPQEPPQRAPRRIEMSDPRVSQPYVIRQYLVPTYDPANPDEAAALVVLASVLGDGVSSRLSKSLMVEQGISIGAGASYSPRARDRTDFTVYGVPSSGRTLTEIETAIDEILDTVRAEGPTDAELTRIKRVMRASRIFSQDSIGSQANLYGAALAMGYSVSDVQNWPDVVERVTPEAVRDVARKFLIPEASVTGYLRREGDAS